MDRIWEGASSRVFIPKSAFLRGLADWDLRQIMVRDQLHIAVLSRGPEFHFQVLADIPITRATVRAVVEPIIEQHGFALTKTPKSDARQHRFNKLVGFQVAGEDEYDIHYRVDASTLLAGKGGRKCQS